MSRLRQKRGGGYYVDCVVAGSRVRRSLHTRDFSLAWERYAAFSTNPPSATPAETPRSHSLVNLSRWYVEIRLSGAPESSVRTARASWQAFVNWCNGRGICRVSELNAATVLMWYGSMLHKGYGRASAGVKIDCIRAGIRAAASEGLIPADPVGLWPRAMFKRETLDEFATEQLRQLLEVVKRYAPEVYPVLLFLSATAWRLSDALWVRRGQREGFGAAVSASENGPAVHAGGGLGAGRSAVVGAAASGNPEFWQKQKVPLYCGPARLARAA